MSSAARVLLLGLGTFGGQTAVARYFRALGARVTATDKKPREKLEESARELEALGVRLVLGEHPAALVDDADLVVRSPAVPASHELVKRAQERKIPVTTEIVLTLARLRAPYVAVTGTKGKSTTTALLGAILGGHVGGNIGKPLLERAASIGAHERVVLELSSFMAEDIREARERGEGIPAPRVLAITSLAPEHLDRHGTKEAYYAAKLSLARGMTAEDAVVFADQGDLAGLARTIEGPRLVPVKLAIEDGRVMHEGEALFRAATLRLAGRHNLENAALAAVAAREVGASPEEIERGIAGFEALPHRLETVARDSEGRLYVNDSIATTPEAALAGLAAYDRPVVLLLGGSDKGSDFGELAREVAARAHGVVCLGALGPKLFALIAGAVEARRTLLTSRPTVVQARTFEDAFALARTLCPPGGVVLLSPGCASYDMFRNFEERGGRFAELARAACSAGGSSCADRSPS